MWEYKNVKKSIKTELVDTTVAKHINPLVSLTLFVMSGDCACVERAECSNRLHYKLNTYGNGMTWEGMKKEWRNK
jgi:hypothetical protein